MKPFTEVLLPLLIAAAFWAGVMALLPADRRASADFSMGDSHRFDQLVSAQQAIAKHEERQARALEQIVQELKRERRGFHEVP